VLVDAYTAVYKNAGPSYDEDITERALSGAQWPRLESRQGMLNIGNMYFAPVLSVGEKPNRALFLWYQRAARRSRVILPRAVPESCPEPMTATACEHVSQIPQQG